MQRTFWQEEARSLSGGKAVGGANLATLYANNECSKCGAIYCWKWIAQKPVTLIRPFRQKQETIFMLYFLSGVRLIRCRTTHVTLNIIQAERYAFSSSCDTYAMAAKKACSTSNFYLISKNHLMFSENERSGRGTRVARTRPVCSIKRWNVWGMFAHLHGNHAATTRSRGCYRMRRWLWCVPPCPWHPRPSGRLYRPPAGASHKREKRENDGAWVACFKANLAGTTVPPWAGTDFKEPLEFFSQWLQGLQKLQQTTRPAPTLTTTHPIAHTKQKTTTYTVTWAIVMDTTQRSAQFCLSAASCANVKHALLGALSESCNTNLCNKKYPTFRSARLVGAFLQQADSWLKKRILCDLKF